MERISYRITLDVHKHGVQRTLAGIETGDKMSRRIVMSLMANGKTVELPLDHVVAMMYVPHAGGYSVNECEIDENSIIYNIHPEDIAAAGRVVIQMKLIDTRVQGARAVLCAPRIALEVYESDTDDDAAEDSTTFTALENAVAKAQAVYDCRLLRIEFTEDYIFRAIYADGTVYESDALINAVKQAEDRLRDELSLLSKSWAVGGTGIREGEDTDNSKYYSNVARSASADVDMVAEEAEELLDEMKEISLFTVFSVDFETGELLYLSHNFEFDVNEETGDLDCFGPEQWTPTEIIKDALDEWMAEETERLAQLVEEVNEKLSSSLGSDVSELGDAETVSDGDYIVVGNPEAKKITFADFISLIKEKLKLGAAAFLGVANDLVTATSGTKVLDAYQGKALDEKKLNKDLSVLTAQTDIADTDNLLVGSADVKKITFANLFSAIKTKLALGAAAFLGVANDLTTTNAGFVLDGRMGKKLADMIADVSTSSTTVKISNTNCYLYSYGGGTSSVGELEGWTPLDADYTLNLYKLGKVVAMFGTINAYKARTDMLVASAFANLIPEGYRPATHAHGEADNHSETHDGYNLAYGSANTYAFPVWVFTDGRISFLHSYHADQSGKLYTNLKIMMLWVTA